MARSMHARRATRFRRLNYGSITLVPVNDRDEYPHNRPENADKWHVPGRKIESMDALVRRATRRGITVTLTEIDNDGTSTRRLN